APILAMIPLVTVGISVPLTLKILSVLAGWGWIGVFTGLEVYVTVVVYGAGVDYCLFLIARYREELDRSGSLVEAIQAAVGHVGAALATSAGTSIFGIGMMAFADFGKFRQAGIAISLGLTVVLLSALTFTPALLHLCGRWAFWPDLRRERLDAGAGWLPTFSLTRFLSEQEWLDRFWEKVAALLLKRPATIFVATVLALLPAAFIGWFFQSHLSYGLLTDLPQRDPSVLGAKAVQEHFPAGVAGPMVVLLQHPEFDLGRRSDGTGGKTDYKLSSGIEISRGLVESLRPHLAEVGIADIRCQGYPFGLETRAGQLDKRFNKVGFRKALSQGAWNMYACITGPHAGTVMQFDVISDRDPFVRDSINQLDRVEAAILAAVPEQFRDGVQIYTLGPTANLRDLKLVTDRDRVLIDVLVVVVVFVLLVALLRQPGICAYLLLTVVFSFLVTLGTTYLVFRLGVGEEFAGLDWKIPLFLFTILIAIGEDYNILLMARVAEEQPRHGRINGVLVALTRTGGIISSCGIIMAGTFASLMTGTLLGMVEMGFALAFGVLLDTFVVRPILVPAFLILLYSGRLGVFSTWAGTNMTDITSDSTTRVDSSLDAELPGQIAPAGLPLEAPEAGEFVEKSL
ncbi:MAG: MMPL family transporter, partial [Planctomycetaceae bacterium]|nr:MMPL family transporter [Planctomycetaceae bacterium]